MFLSGSFFGEGFFSNSPPTRQSYGDIFLTGGNASCVIDAMHVLDYEMTDDDIKLQDLVESTNLVLDSTVDFLMNQTEFLSNYGNEPEYGENTILCANFEDTLEAGSLVTSVPYPLTGYVVRRKIKDSSLNPILVTINDPLEVEYVDHTPRNKISYIYEVTPVFEDGGVNRIEGRGVISEEVFVDYFGYILSDTLSATPTQVYTFTIELESDTFKYNTGFKLFENHTKFPAYRQNNRNYLSGSLSTIPLTDEYEVSEALLQDIVDFINNGSEKILRTPSGRILRVVTMGASFKYMDRIAAAPATLKFDFVEVAEVI